MDGSGDIPQALVDHLQEEPDDVPPFVVLLAAVAHADGVFDEEERAEVRGALGAVIGTTVTETALKHFVGQGLATLAQEGVEEALVASGKALAEAGILVPALEVALDLAGATDGIDASEQAVILTAARAGGMSDEEILAVLEG